MEKTIWSGLRQAHDQEVEQREEGEGDDTSVYEGGSSHPLFIGGGKTAQGGGAANQGAAPTSNLIMWVEAPLNSLNLHSKIPMVISFK